MCKCTNVTFNGIFLILQLLQLSGTYHFPRVLLNALLLRRRGVTLSPVSLLSRAPCLSLWSRLCSQLLTFTDASRGVEHKRASRSRSSSCRRLHGRCALHFGFRRSNKWAGANHWIKVNHCSCWLTDRSLTSSSLTLTCGAFVKQRTVTFFFGLVALTRRHVCCHLIRMPAPFSG